MIGGCGSVKHWVTLNLAKDLGLPWCVFLDSDIGGDPAQVLSIQKRKKEVEEAGKHYTMGGIETDQNCETRIKGLFAVGECSSVGLHGANRLGSNSLAELVVFGRLAGEQATVPGFMELRTYAGTGFLLLYGTGNSSPLP